MEQKLTLHKLPDAEKLLAYGFDCSGAGIYFLSRFILANSMRAEVIVSLPDAISIKLFDAATDEEYILHKIPEATGAFVGSVREAYYNLLLDIVEKCFYTETFKSAAAKFLLGFAKEQYGTDADYPFSGKTKDYAVLRCKDNSKWYAILMTISRKKLGAGTTEMVEAVNFHDSMENVTEYLKAADIYPAYHMNKKYWYTICLSDFKDFDKLKTLASHSYEYTECGAKKTKIRDKAKNPENVKKVKTAYPFNLLCKAYDIQEEELRKFPGIAFIDESLEYVFATLKDYEAETLQLYFKDGLTLTEIGRRHDRTLECIRRWLAKALRKLRTLKRYRVIQYGVAEYNRQEKKRAQETYDKAYKILSMPDDTPIETLELSSLSNFRLHHIGVETIGDLKRKHFRDELQGWLYGYTRLNKELTNEGYLKVLNEMKTVCIYIKDYI